MIRVRDGFPRAFRRLRTRFPVNLAIEMSWVLGGQAATLVAFVLSTKVLASYLGQVEYGRLALGMTVPIFLNQFLFGPLTVAAMRFYAPYEEKGLVRTMVIGIFRFLWPAAAAMLALGLLISLGISVRAGVSWGWLIISMVLFGLFQGAQGVFNALQVAARRRASAAVHQALDPVMRLLLGTAAVLLVARRSEVVAAALAIGMAFVFLSQYYWFRRNLPPGHPPQLAQLRAIQKALWDYGKHFVIWGPFTWGQLASDRWSLKLFHGDSAVGLYAVAYQLASIPSVIVAGAFAQFLSPIVFQRAGDGSNSDRMALSLRLIRIGILTMATWITAAVAVSIFLGGPIMELFASESYRPGAVYVPLIILGAGLMQMGHLLALVPLTFNKMLSYRRIKVLHGLAAILLNLLGARLFGIVGVCVSLVIAGVAYVAIVAINNGRIVALSHARSTRIAPS